MQEVPHRVRIVDYHAEAPSHAAARPASVVVEREPVAQRERDEVAVAGGRADPLEPSESNSNMLSGK